MMSQKEIVSKLPLSRRFSSLDAATVPPFRSDLPLDGMLCLHPGKAVPASTQHMTLPSFAEFCSTLLSTSNGASDPAPARQVEVPHRAAITSVFVEPPRYTEADRERPEYWEERSQAYAASRSYLANTMNIFRPIRKPTTPKPATDTRLLRGIMEAVRFGVVDKLVRPSLWKIEDSSFAHMTDGNQQMFYLKSITETMKCPHEGKLGDPAVRDEVFVKHSQGSVMATIASTTYKPTCPTCLRRLLAGCVTHVEFTGGVLWYRAVCRLPGGSREEQRKNKKKGPKETNPAKAEATANIFRHTKKAGPNSNKKDEVRYFAVKRQPNCDGTHERPKVEQAYREVDQQHHQEEGPEAAPDTTEVQTETPLQAVETGGVGPSGETSSSWVPPESEKEVIEEVVNSNPPPAKEPIREEVAPQVVHFSHRHGVCECSTECFPILTDHIKSERPTEHCPFTSSSMNIRLKQMHRERKDTNPCKLKYSKAQMASIRSFCAKPFEYSRVVPTPSRDEIVSIVKYLTLKFSDHPLRYYQDEKTNRWISLIANAGPHRLPHVDGMPEDSPYLTSYLIERNRFSLETVGECSYDWCHVPRGVKPDRRLLVTRPFPGLPHIPVGVIAVPLIPSQQAWVKNVHHATIGFVSKHVPVAHVTLKHALFAKYLCAATSKTWNETIFGPEPAPELRTDMPPIPGFGILSGQGPSLTKALLAPTQPPADIKTMSNVFKKGTHYEFNAAMKRTAVGALFNKRLNIRQKLLASGLIKCNPSTLGLSPGPVVEDPASSYEVTCESAPLKDVTWDGTKNVDLRCDQTRNAELLHKESVVQVWTYRRYYCGMPLAEARFYTDSNVLTAVMSAKSNLHPLLSPATKQALFTEEVYRALSFCNVKASDNHLVLDAIEAASLVLQVKSMNKTEVRSRLGACGKVSVFH